MMKQIYRKDSFKLFYGILVLTGLFSMAGGAGNMDFDADKEFENQNLGYEKNIIDHKKSRRNSAIAIAFGAGLMGEGVFGLKKIEQKSKTR